MFAVNVGATAMPLFPVVAFADITPPGKVPLAPLPGAVKVTDTPLTGFPPASVTVARRAVVNAVPAVVLCGVPPEATIPAGEPAVFVKLKLALPDTPEALAVTA